MTGRDVLIAPSLNLKAAVGIALGDRARGALGEVALPSGRRSIKGWSRRTVLAAGLLGLILGPGCDSRPRVAGAETEAAVAAKGVREPAVAGFFYPAEGPVLARTVDRLLEEAPARKLPRVRALLCPHAGYAYSGPTAAAAYKVVAEGGFRTVIILAASHYASFGGVSVPKTAAYRTPLGLVPVSPQARELARSSPFVLEPGCLVQRPSWWRQASKAAPPAGEDTPETWEHSVEVQLPFLQKALKEFAIIPVVFGDADPEAVARALLPILDEEALVVASSDLSHYHPYEVAKALDGRCVRAVCELDVRAMSEQEACGKQPILTLLHLARMRGWQARLLDARNSGDTGTEREQVVGYAAVAFEGPGGDALSSDDRRYVLGLARRGLRALVEGGELPEVDEAGVPAALREKRACFVTLTKAGGLRGCIGHLQPQEALWKAVLDNTRNAALRDPRFPPVGRGELGEIRIEISVLTLPRPLSYTSADDLAKRLRPGRDGVVLRIGARSATFLPQVWEQIPDRVAFLEHLSQKAGCGASAWRGADVSVLTYEVEAFGEPE